MTALANLLAWARRALVWLFARLRGERGVRSSRASPQSVKSELRRSRTQAVARPRAKSPLGRTILGHGPVPERPASVRSAPSEPPSSYEAKCDWAPDPCISGSTTRAELRALCDQLYLLAAKGCFVIRIASDADSAGEKSHVSAQLAWSLAEFGRARVLLLEADFDAPGVHHVMRLATPPFKGFSQQIYARTVRGERAPWSVARCASCLFVLAEGRVRTPGLVQTEQFSSALAELRRCYDIIVVDGPAVDGATDTRALDGVADGVVFAVDSDVDTSEALRRAAATFGNRALLWIVHTAVTQFTGRAASGTSQSR